MTLPDANLLVNRELSWLGFDARVLEEAADPTVPLLERLRFLAIFSSNLDEFFMVRYAGLWSQIGAGVQTPGPDGLTPAEVLARVSRRVRTLVEEQHRLLLEGLLPELGKHGVRLLPPAEIGEAGRAFLLEWFSEVVLPIVTPIAINLGHHFPYLPNRAISLLAELAPREAGGQNDLCLLHLPVAALPRFVRLPGPSDRYDVVLLEDVIRLNLDLVFPGDRVVSCHAIRVTRDAELEMEGESAEDLLATIEEAVRNRRLGAAVRLQYERALPESFLARLCQELELEAGDVFPSAGFIGFADLFQLYSMVDLPALKAPVWVPRPVAVLEDAKDPFAVIDRQDVLVHHPYQSFEPVVRLVEHAATDPSVLAIKMTLYRVSADSRIAQALLAAAHRGKEVAVVVELRARFSEEANIAWARKLEAAGAHVVFGFTQHKTHVKATLVVRRVGGRIRRICHLATGNYNEQSASAYTDLSLFTSRREFGEDLTRLFNLLTGNTRPPTFKHLLVAPHAMRNELVARIRREADHARAGRPAGLVAKMNSLVDPGLIHELYQASQAGVPIALIVRGICCLRPGLPGVSDNIRVVSIVDRFLEHARIVRFVNGGAPEHWLGSADWMPRNLDGRYEAMFPVLEPEFRKQLDEILELQLADDVKARVIGPDGEHSRPVPGAVRAQERLMWRHADDVRGG